MTQLMMNDSLIENSYLGFTDNMKPMQKAKAENVLDGLIRSNGIVMTYKEWVYSKLQNGAKPNKEENYSYYSSKTQTMTKPKTIYMIQWQQVNHSGRTEDVYNEINKTLHDFACHVVNNNLLNERILKEYIAKEKQKANQAAQTELERQAIEQAKIEQEKQEKEQFQQWLNEKIQSYNSKEKIELYLSVFNDAYPERPATELQARTFLVYVDNIHIPQCRKALQDRLHTGNKVSKKIFYHITGIKLPNTDKETMHMLDYLTGSHYYGSVPYKAKHEYSKGIEGKEKFYLYVNGIGYMEAYGDKVEYKGITGYVFSSGETGTIIVEARAGVSMAKLVNNSDAMEMFKSTIDQHGIDKINSLVNNLIEKNGMSPLYKESENILVNV